MAPRRSERQTPEQAAESIRLDKEKRARALGSAFVPPRTCYLPTTSTRPVVPSITSFHSPILPPVVPSFLPSFLPFIPSSLFHFLLSLKPPLLRPYLLTPFVPSFHPSFLSYLPCFLPALVVSYPSLPVRTLEPLPPYHPPLSPYLLPSFCPTLFTFTTPQPRRRPSRKRLRPHQNGRRVRTRPKLQCLRALPQRQTSLIKSLKSATPDRPKGKEEEGATSTGSKGNIPPVPFVPIFLPFVPLHSYLPSFLCFRTFAKAKTTCGDCVLQNARTSSRS
jgi:hypothetical protein